MINDQIEMRGDVTVQLFDKDGNVKDTRKIKNMVVTAGKGFIAASMLKTTTNSPIAMTHMALGSNNTAAAIGDTALAAELGRAALASATVSGAVVTYTATFNPTVGTGAVVEAGIFNASSSGTMLCRTVFSVVNKGVDDTMSITWQITVS
jgi:hypothetical protein